MAGGISINILANVRGAVQGVTDVAEAVEEAADRLHDLTKEGDTAADRMEGDFREISRAADRSADQLRDKFRQAYKDIRRSSDDTADEVVRNQRKMGERSAEVGQEIRQNLGEGIANAARGDFASLSDTIGDTLGGAVAGIGGVGAAAAAAATAAGVGALVLAFTSAEEKRKQLEERANDLAEAYIAAGGTVLDALTIADRTADILTDPERKKEAQDLAKLLGGDLPLAIRALAGDSSALAEVNTRAAAANQANADAVNETIGASESLVRARSEEFRENEKLIAKTKELNEIQENAALTSQVQSDILVGLINSTKDVTKEVDEFGNSLFTLPDGKQILVNADTGQATTNIDAFKGDVDGIPENVTTKVRFEANTKAVKRQIKRDLSGIVVGIQLGAGINRRDAE